MEVVHIKAKKRESLGKKSTKAVRANGLIPGVVYSKNTNIAFSVHPNEVKSLIYTPDFKLAELDCEGKTYRCFIKDLQAHPVTDEIEHIDFQELVDGHKVKLQIPVRLEGTSEGQKLGGQLMQLVRSVRIKTTPENIIDKVVLDISALQLGQSVRVRDIKATDGVELMDDSGMPLGSVIVPRSLKSQASAAAKEDGVEGSAEEATE